MLNNAFAVPVWIVKCPLTPELVEQIKSYVQSLFAQHRLEQGDAHSTSTIIRDIHKQPFMEPIVKFVEEEAKKFWNEYGLHSNHSPYINECWVNRHGTGGKTLQHNHSRSMISAAFYIQYRDGNGGLIFHNPLHYHQCHELRDMWYEEDICLDIEEFDIVFFPGYLDHSTEENVMEEERLVMTFNFESKVNENKRYNVNSDGELVNENQ